MKLITGMHRSGTSLVARLLYEGGADLGDPVTFYRPDKWNPDGYFEQPEIHAINMPLINGPFWKFAYFQLPSRKTILKRSHGFADRIRAASKKYDGKVVKEVRFSLTLPAWLAHGAHIEKILVCLREPVEVARSVQRRNKVTLRRGYNLWYEHNRRLVDQANDIPLWFLSYANLLDEERFDSELTAVFRFFDLSEAARDPAALRGLVKTPRNRHDTGRHVTYPAHVQSLWNELLARHAEQLVPAVPSARVIS